VSLLNPIVTCGYVNTVYTVCYVVNNRFFLRMDSRQLVYWLRFSSVFLFHAFCVFVHLYWYHLVVKAASTDRY